MNIQDLSKQETERLKNLIREFYKKLIGAEKITNWTQYKAVYNNFVNKSIPACFDEDVVNELSDDILYNEMGLGTFDEQLEKIAEQKIKIEGLVFANSSDQWRWENTTLINELIAAETESDQ